MKDNHFSFDEIVHQKLYNYEETPPSHVWKSIESRTTKSNFVDKRWLLSLLLFCVAGVFGSVFVTLIENSIEKRVVNNNNSNQNKVESQQVVKNVESENKTTFVDKNKDMDHIVIETPNIEVRNMINKTTNSNHINLNPSNDIKIKDETYISKLDFQYFEILSKPLRVKQTKFEIKKKRKTKIYTGNLFVNFKKRTKEIQFDRLNAFASKFDIDILLGPSISGRELNGNQKLMELRNNSENSNFAYNASLMLNYKINPRWSLKSGLMYLHRNETANNFNGTTSKNMYQSFDIPILICYNKPIYLTKVQLFGGIDLDVKRKKTGSVLNEYSNLVSISTIPFKTGVIPKVYAGANVCHPINKTIDFLGQLNYISSIGSVTESSYGLQQSEYHIGLTFGIKIKINQ